MTTQKVVTTTIQSISGKSVVMDTRTVYELDFLQPYFDAGWLVKQTSLVADPKGFKYLLVLVLEKTE